MSKFKQKVIQAVKSVPYGKVASYGQIALMVGVPRAARQVGWVLNSLEESIVEKQNNIPWWRIVNNAGIVSIKGTKYHDKSMQKEKLEYEGVKFLTDLSFDIENYRFRPSVSILKRLKLDDEYIDALIKKYSI